MKKARINLSPTFPTRLSHILNGVFGFGGLCGGMSAIGSHIHTRRQMQNGI